MESLIQKRRWCIESATDHSKLPNLKWEEMGYLIHVSTPPSHE